MNRKTLVPIVAAVVLISGGTAAAAVANGGDRGDRGGRPSIELSLLGRHNTDIFDEGAAEIVAHDPATNRLFVVSAAAARIEILDIKDPSSPALVATLDTADAVNDPEAVANSVAVRKDGVIAVAVESGSKVDPGWVAFYSRTGQLLNVVGVGALPDMLTFTPDGRTLLVANEAEPSADFTFDPEGSVSVIDVSRRIESLSARNVQTADFRAWDNGAEQLDPRVRVFGPDVTGRADGSLADPGRVARNLEPEYIAVDDNSRTAYVTLQEANAFAVLDIRDAKIVDIVPFGFKDYLLPGNELDVSDQDGAIRLANWPVYGMYQPDTVATYKWRGKTLLVTANEGDVREWGSYVEAVRMRSLTGTTPICADSSRVQAFLADNDLGITTVDQLRANTNLGRLNLTQGTGLRADGTCYEDLYAFGGRSFAIWDTDGALLWDSGDDFERITAETNPAFFNSTSTDNNLDNRSDDKGPEPEGVTIGTIRGKTYAFTALERVGGIMIYDITDPRAPQFVQYLNTRDFTADPESRQAGDLAPEGLHFIEAQDSPTHEPLLAVANEVSGTTSLFRIDITK